MREIGDHHPIDKEISEVGKRRAAGGLHMG